MRSVKELAIQANSYEFNPDISFRSWLHVLKTMLIQAKAFEAHHDLEDAYILYLRWADLALNRMPKHPQFKPNKARYDELVGQLSQVLKDAEKVKHQIQSAPQVVVQQEQPVIEIPPSPESREETPEPVAQPNLETLDLSTLRSLRRPSQLEAPVVVQVPHYDVGEQPQRHFETLDFSSAATSTIENTLISTSSSTHKATATTEGGESLRTVFVPSNLQTVFLSHAALNTAKNLETCGILCGRMNRNAYFVSDLVIPKQESTANSCSTTHEEELFDYVESKDLFILGWIHTHPTQSCFMSSVDLHTHNSYQIMLPEAIAIVCSPQHDPKWGAFRLTSPPGMDIITKCRQVGFHPHNEKDIYKSVIPGHMRLYDYEFTVKDLR